MADDVRDPSFNARLEAINDELHIVRRLLEKPSMHPPEVYDLLRIAIQKIHGMYEELAVDVRRRNHVDKLVSGPTQQRTQRLRAWGWKHQPKQYNMESTSEITTYLSTDSGFTWTPDRGASIPHLTCCVERNLAYVLNGEEAATIVGRFSTWKAKQEA